MITAVALVPGTADYMDGDGNIFVNAEMSVSDAGRDIATFWVRKPDGETVSFAESLDTVTGSITESIPISTTRTGAFTFEFWLVDRVGNRSPHRVVDFVIDWTVQ